MNNIPSIVMLGLVIAGIVLAVAALVMPIVVIVIDSRLAKIHKVLAAMERNSRIRR